MTHLYEMTAQYREALEALNDPDIPNEARMDTLAALEGGLMVKGQNVGAYILNLRAERDMVKAVEEKMIAKRRLMDNSIAWYEKYLKSNMEASGIGKIEAPDHSFKITLLPKRASLVIDEINSLPADLITYEKVVVVNKSELKKRLENGEIVEGSHLDWNCGLRIS